MSEQESRDWALLVCRPELLGLIGRGSFSQVYRACDRKLDHEAAVKQLFGSPQHDTLKRRCGQKIRIHSRLKSKHLVSLYDTLEEGDTAFALWSVDIGVGK